MTTPFNLKIITPSGVFFDGQTKNVIIRTTVGDKGILAKHEPYVAALPIGTIRVLNDNRAYKPAAVSAGTVQVDNSGDTVILVQSCEWREPTSVEEWEARPRDKDWSLDDGIIDLERAKEAEQKAEACISDKNASDVQKDIAAFKLKRALNRLGN
ncbi:MAG: F0F1 ATP synthase subunit epsilon [Oscillospiraceae bacterium]|nr:F0F1 ATP synthase subunit epsilon [Oscillospiraceae bacterium]